MTRVLFTTMPIPGHVRPGLPIARELVRRGHEVAWYTGGEFEAAVTRAGAAFHPSDAVERFLDREDRPAASGLRQLRWDIRHGFLGPTRRYLDDLAAVADAFEPEVVVADQGFVAGPLLAELRGIPNAIYTITPLTTSSPDTAPFGTGLPPATTPAGRLRNRALNWALQRVVFGDSQREARRIRREAGIDVPPGFFLDWFPHLADRFLHTTVPGFEYPRREWPAAVRFVGAILPDGVDAWERPAWWADLDRGRPVVLVTQGTVATEPRNLLLPAIEALAGEDALVVATTGGPDPEQVLPRRDRPGNLRLEAFVPFTQILPAAAAMVTNGGYGGVQTALAHGVPLVVAGRSEDKAEVSARIAWSGAGLSLGTDTPSPVAVGAAVRRVLAEPSYRDRAGRLAAEYARYPAAELAADLVLDAMRRGDEALNAMNTGGGGRRVGVEFYDAPVHTLG